MSRAEEFEAAVKDGLRLSKRIFFGKDRAVAPPKPPSAMERSAGCSYLPTSPMLYAVITNPEIVDNPDMPSYQPYVHGKCDPPALVPLQMNNISMEVDCYLDTAFVTVNGSWRVHCVMGSRSCDCRIAVPMGEKGSILGVEVEVPMKSYCTQLTAMDNDTSNVSKKKGNSIEKEKIAKIEDEPFITPHIFTITVPKIDGGTNLSVKLRWSQKLTYCNGQLTLSIPFCFPEYVTPAVKKIRRHEKIELNVNSGPGAEILCNSSSHPLKERFRQEGKLGFLYDTDVLSWSSNDFVFNYTISSSDTFGTVLLSPPLSIDADSREMFCCYIFPGNQQSKKVFRREVVFVVDISGSMRGKLLEDTKNALFDALTKLGPEDLFNIIAFNGDTYLFSSSLQTATAASIQNAVQWISLNFVAGGGTNILLPLNQAIEMFSDTRNSIPLLFLITDGAVEDERHICDRMRNYLTDRKTVSPRIYTLGIGTFCNHYFLQKLALLGHGHHDAVNDVDLMEERVRGLFDRALSICLANITFDLDEIDDLEVFPSPIPDLSSESPLIVSGRYRGKFPDTLKVKGILSDMSNVSVDLKVQDANEEIPVRKMLAKQEIELLTAESWYSDSKELKEKVINTSVQNDIVSEYTDMILLETEKRKINAATARKKQKVAKVADSHEAAVPEPKPRKVLVLHNTGIGFGNVSATGENIRPHRSDEPGDVIEVFTKGASKCCGNLCCNNCCCMGCIQVCSKVNDQFAILLTQLCGGLSCLACFACCEQNG